MSQVEESEDVYDVERIVDDRIYKGEKQYLIKWVGYSESDNTWELKSNLFCTEMLEEYEKNKRDNAKKDKNLNQEPKDASNITDKKDKIIDNAPNSIGKKNIEEKNIDANLISKSAKKEKQQPLDNNAKGLEYVVSTIRDTLDGIKVKNRPMFERQVTNEWDLKIKEVANVFVKDSLLYVEFIDIYGNSGTCTSQEIKYKAPLKLLAFYEENLAFSE